VSEDRLLDAAAVAELLSVPVSWVRQETRAGRMPCLELGRYRRYEWDAVVEWLQGRRSGTWRKHTPKVSA
jgi:hypothetical protein